MSELKLFFHALGLALLVFALFLDSVSVVRWVRWANEQTETPGYGCFPLPIYLVSSLLIWSGWKAKFISMLLFASLHIGYQMILLALRKRAENKGIGRYRKRQN